jgi:hypothetical protein
LDELVADIILFNGKVVTLDRENTITEIAIGKELV